MVVKGEILRETCSGYRNILCVKGYSSHNSLCAKWFLGIKRNSFFISGMLETFLHVG